MRINVSDVELQRAKDILEPSDLVSESTKGCYSSRIALWMHYCAECCNGDEQVTGQRLSDYVEWLVSSGSAERIRQGTTHIQQVLRNQLQGVMCYWRIQIKNRPNADDPRSDPAFKRKWQQFILRYPSSRHSRRAEPIYGGNPSIAPYPSHVGPAHAGSGGYPSLRNGPSAGIASPAMAATAIQAPGRNPNYRPHPSQMSQPRQSSPPQSHPQAYPQQSGAPQRSWNQPPYEDRVQPSRHQSPSMAHAPAPYPGTVSNRSNMPGHPSYSQQSQTVPDRAPPGSAAAHYPSKPGYPMAPQNPGALSHQRPLAPNSESHNPHLSPRSQSAQLPSSQHQHQNRMHENMGGHPIMPKGVMPHSNGTGSSGPHDPNASRMSVDSEDGVISGMSSRVPDNADISRPASDGATAVPSSPKISSTQYVLEGIVPEDIPEWSANDAKESADTPEGHLLNLNESIALSIRQLGVRPDVQMQARAHILLGMASWIPAFSRTELTLGDIWTEESSDIPLPNVEIQEKLPDSIAVEAASSPENQAATRSEEPDSFVKSVDENTSSDEPLPTSVATDHRTSSDKEEGEFSPDKEMVEDSPVREKTPPKQEQEQQDHEMADSEVTDIEPEKQTEAPQPENRGNDDAEAMDLSAKALLDIKNQEPSRQQKQQVQPLRVLSIALCTFGGRASNNSLVGDKALVLRHNNPLLCPWGALAFMLFSRWHVANEPEPDFSSSAWQSLKLFPGVSSDNDGTSSISDGYKRLFDEAISGVTKDKLDCSKVMSDAGYFYADTFGLVRPTSTGIKGLDGIDAISANTLQPEVLSALVRANAGYPADSAKECTAPKRFGVMPSQSLQKELFPWIKPLLIGAFEQSNNNDDVRSATRLLRVLRELRIVLLQDVAFLMEMPYLKKVVEENAFFKHEIFSSPDFNVLRREMHAAVGETEIREMESMCTAAVNWVKNRRSEISDNSAKRMVPTAPRLLNPDTYSVSANGAPVGGPDQQRLRPRPENLSHTPESQKFPGAPSLPSSHAMDEERKRQRDLDEAGGDDSGYYGEAGDDAYDSNRHPKRSRRIYEMALSGPTYRMYGDAATTPGQADQNSSNSVVGGVPDSVMEALNSLRVENQDLKAHVRKLEWLLSQHKAEVQAWMGKMEKTVQGNASSAAAAAAAAVASASQQPSPHPRSDPMQSIRSMVPPSVSPGMAARQPPPGAHLQPTSPTSYPSRQQQQYHHEHTGSQHQLSQPSTPRTRYSDVQYQQSAVRTPGMHGQASLHGIREPGGPYERPPIDGVSNGRQYQQMPMRIPPSPRSQSYGH
ncbi:hypothetical protein EV175_003963, partial [Coemansia sp. RSA 1933]